MKRKIFGILMTLVLAVSLGLVAAVPAIASVNTYYVNAATGNDSPGNGSLSYPWKTIQYAIDNASAGSTIVVASGTYNERLNIDKPLSLQGAQYGVDPTQSGVRTTSSNESIIDLTGLTIANPNVLIDIPSGISNVSLNGFTLIGSPTFNYSDEAVIRCSSDNITIQDNIINGYYGVLYNGTGQNINVQNNRIIVNKTGVTCQSGGTNVTISNNVFTLGSAPADDAQAIYMTGCINSAVTGNTATNFKLRGLSGSNLTNLTVSGNNFVGTGNPANNSGDAISIWGSSTNITINNNNLSNSLDSGITIKGQDITITNNTIANNGNVGVEIDHNLLITENVVVSNNNIFGNTNYGLNYTDNTTGAETVNAISNWWGNASGPLNPSSNPSGTGNSVSDNVSFVPWLTGENNGTSTNLTANVPDIIAISVNPTTIDFGALIPGMTSNEYTITVTNIGTHQDVTVGASLDLNSSSLFLNNLLLKLASGSYNTSIHNWPGIVTGLNSGASTDLKTELPVPSSYQPKGTQNATLIFTASP